jgi:hypothetical protein
VTLFAFDNDYNVTCDLNHAGANLSALTDLNVFRMSSNAITGDIPEFLKDTGVATIELYGV